MLTLLDRQLIYSYLKGYFVVLVSLLGLFIVVDLFTHLDDFAQNSKDFQATLWYIGYYYGHTTAVIFDRLAEAIVLLSAMFTVAWVQRSNELIPLLSAGVSTRRVVRPVLVAGFAMLSLTVLNQEILLPRVDRFIIEFRGDPIGEKEINVQGGFEANGIHISGMAAIKKDLTIKNFAVIFPETQGRIVHLQAKEAKYFPPSGDRKGFWDLSNTTPAELDVSSHAEVLVQITSGRFRLFTSEMDFDKATRSRNWAVYTPTWRLFNELGKSDTTKQSSVAVLFHVRLTRPLLGMILVFMGLGVILRDQNRNVFISAGLCLGLCALFFLSCFAAQSLGNHDYVSPALAAWLPVLVFGPLSFVMFDAVHT